MVERLDTRIGMMMVGLLCAAASCKPDIAGRPSLVQSDRVLAVRSLPADAKPQTAVTYQGLFVGADGPLDADALTWALCHERKSLTEPGSLAASCLKHESPALETLGAGGVVQGNVLKDACEVFGPTPAIPKAGEPSARPVDPDTTGGYYQTVRVSPEDSDDYAIGVTRVACGLAGATQQQSADFTKRYHPNENPALTRLVLHRADGTDTELVSADDDDSQIASVASGEALSFEASWNDCPTEPDCGDGMCTEGEDNSPANCPADCAEPHGCAGSEGYVYFDPLNRALGPRREAMRVSWFANAGRFEHERTGRAESEAARTSTRNAWTAPDAGGDVWLWAVIRDDRGGVGYASYRLRVD